MRWVKRAVLLVRKFMYKMNRDRIKAYSAGAAFFIIMSFFPFLMLLLALVQYTPLTQEQIVRTLEEITPLGLTEELKQIVNGVYSQASALLPWTGIAAVWSAGKGVLGLSDGLNAVFQIEETRNYIMIRVRAAFYTIGMILALILSFGILVLGYRLQEFLRSSLPFFARYSDLMLLLQLGLAMLLLFLLFEIFYVFLPNRRKSFHSQVPGALFSSISWAVFSYGFSIYLNYAGNMSVIYGSLTTLVVVMLWLYICMYLLFLGAEINSYLEKPELFSLDRKDSCGKIGDN
ncbi:MAG TPA: YihY/virulence factor BrkB family protein [Candidatus Choladousia intestinavium]|uniref:YihY/virulence factor BrkB family protein n=1 Tax=Candidatus Choladousia intestinavium TaxID=2840727 RepID=A0A9D1ADI6_9FIRM|nr:YihY/virulence factor BrkB family protein [Candidatus Choladousia intestinavium]